MRALGLVVQKQNKGKGGSSFSMSGRTELVRAPGHPNWDRPQEHQGEAMGSLWAEVHRDILAVLVKL